MKKILIIAISSIFLTACATTSENNQNNIENSNYKNKIVKIEGNEPEMVVESNADIVANGKPVSLSDYENATFTLKTIDGAKPPVTENLASITFTKTQNLGAIVRGNSGCNLYFTKYKVLRSTLITDEIITTDQKCSYDKIKLEGFMFKIFSQNPILLFEDDTLTMKTPTNTLVFDSK